MEDARQTFDFVTLKLDLLLDAKAKFDQRLERDVNEFRAHRHFQQQQLQDSFVGNDVFDCLKDTFDSLDEEMNQNIDAIFDEYLLGIENLTLPLTRKQKLEVIHEDKVSQPNQSVTREEADSTCRTLFAVNHGTDGIALAKKPRSRLIDPNIISCVAPWIQDGLTQSHILWIKFPFGKETSAMNSVLSVVSGLARANAPFLSYICSKPSQAGLTDSQSAKDAGVLSIAHSLILQLLRFRPQEDEFNFDRNELTKLSGDISSWTTVAFLFYVLLQHTPVRYCIIHGINVLEEEDGIDKCNHLLTALLAHSRPENPLSILFTTSGPSTVLYDIMDDDERASFDQSIQKGSKEGMDLNFIMM